MIQNKYVAFGIFIVIFLILWNVFDFAYSSVIAGNGYHFEVWSDLFSPFAVAMAVGYFLFLRKKKDEE